MKISTNGCLSIPENKKHQPKTQFYFDTTDRYILITCKRVITSENDIVIPEPYSKKAGKKQRKPHTPYELSWNIDYDYPKSTDNSQSFIKIFTINSIFCASFVIKKPC